MLPSSAAVRWQPIREYDFEGGLYCISASRLQQLYLLPESRWTSRYEKDYQAARRRWMECRELIPQPGRTTAGRVDRPEVSLQGWRERREAWLSYEPLAFGRLCAFLRLRDPSAQVGYSINIYRLDDQDLDRALNAPAETLFPNWPTEGKAIQSADVR